MGKAHPTPLSALRTPNGLGPSSPRAFPHRESGISRVPSQSFTDPQGRHSSRGGATVDDGPASHRRPARLTVPRGVPSPTAAVGLPDPSTAGPPVDLRGRHPYRAEPFVLPPASFARPEATAPSRSSSRRETGRGGRVIRDRPTCPSGPPRGSMSVVMRTRDFRPSSDGTTVKVVEVPVSRSVSAGTRPGSGSAIAARKVRTRPRTRIRNRMTVPAPVPPCSTSSGMNGGRGMIRGCPSRLSALMAYANSAGASTTASAPT